MKNEGTEQRLKRDREQKTKKGTRKIRGIFLGYFYVIIVIGNPASILGIKSVEMSLGDFTLCFEVEKEPQRETSDIFR